MVTYFGTLVVFVDQKLNRCEFHYILTDRNEVVIQIQGPATQLRICVPD